MVECSYENQELTSPRFYTSCKTSVKAAPGFQPGSELLVMCPVKIIYGLFTHTGHVMMRHKKRMKEVGSSLLLSGVLDFYSATTTLLPPVWC